MCRPKHSFPLFEHSNNCAISKGSLPGSSKSVCLKHCENSKLTSIIWLNLCLAHFYGIMLLTNTEILPPVGYREICSVAAVQIELKMLLASLGKFNPHVCGSSEISENPVMNFDLAHDNCSTTFFYVKIVSAAYCVANVKGCHYGSNYQNNECAADMDRANEIFPAENEEEEN
ncbi:hypothetical protein Tsp_13874 [Trichinella spiralis]|uniref:hypothetical protein n=1 Tax=Trichinella spiralis TaxID=6334 RepID=UPI0001EFDC8A|nr:hypothetical protein Tsp_13874 [Trichinella spiralis]